MSSFSLGSCIYYVTGTGTSVWTNYIHGSVNSIRIIKWFEHSRKNLHSGTHIRDDSVLHFIKFQVDSLFVTCTNMVYRLIIIIANVYFSNLRQRFIYVLFFLAFDFCRFCVVIRFFFIPATTSNDLRLRRIYIPDLFHYIMFLS